MIILGIDPDSQKHGVALYNENGLADIKMMTTIDIVDEIKEQHPMLVSIEDVNANKFVYARNDKGSRGMVSNIAMRIGKNQQAQLELMRWLDYYGVEYVLHKPTKNNWAKNKAQFEKVTGWTASSNVDTRSAAYFGWLEYQRLKESE